MASLDKITEYTSLICRQIRWKKAHVRVSREIEHHIMDQRDIYLSLGMGEEEATKRAIAETGDPVVLGDQFDQTYRPKPQWMMFASILALLFISFTIQFLLFQSPDFFRLGLKWFFYTGLGILLMLTAYFADFTFIGNHPRIVYFSILLASLVFLILSPRLNGKSFYTQNITLLFSLAFSAVVYAMKNKGYLGIIFCQAAFLPPAFIAQSVPTTLGLLIFSMISMTLLCVANNRDWFGIKKSHGFWLIGLFITAVPALGVAFIFNKPYQWARIAALLNPSKHLQEGGYLAAQVRKMLSTAQMIGKGSMSSEFTTNTISSSLSFQSDFLLTAVINELGWLPFIFIVFIMLFFIINGFKLCLKQKSGLGLFISLTVMMTFTLQTISYISNNLGFISIASLTLPLVSYGNTAMIVNMMMIGTMLGIFRTGHMTEDRKNQGAYTKFFTWEDGKLTINFYTR